MSGPLTCALGILVLGALLTSSPGGATGTVALKLGERVRGAGRADCVVVRATLDPFTRKPIRARGRLSLEPPDRARLEFPQTGERITLRGDGGEWLQPRLRQLIVFPESSAAGARRWWQLLIDGRAPGIELVSKRGRVLRLRSTDGAGPDSARLVLDGAGLPAKLVVPEGGAEVEYRFSRWTFGPARGTAAFTQHAPGGYERVEMP